MIAQQLKILEVMTSAIPEPREDVGENAPKILSFEIPVEKIGEVIGTKGKMIYTIQAETGAEIAVDDDGMSGIVSIASPDREKVTEAERQIMLIVDPPSANVGEIYEGRVVNITKFGAFVNILPGRDGLVHISKLGGGKRIDKVEDVLELGDAIEVEVEDCIKIVNHAYSHFKITLHAYRCDYISIYIQIYNTYFKLSCFNI